MAALLQDNEELQLTAYCDGELDPAAAGEFERRLAADELLKARYTRLMSLRQAVRALPQVDLSSDLQAKIQARLKAETEQSTAERPSNVSNVTVLRRRSWSFQALAASAVFGAVISGSVLKTIDRFGQEDTVASEVVTSVDLRHDSHFCRQRKVVGVCEIAEDFGESVIERIQRRTGFLCEASGIQPGCVRACIAERR